MMKQKNKVFKDTYTSKALLFEMFGLGDRQMCSADRKQAKSEVQHELSCTQQFKHMVWSGASAVQ